MVGGQLVLGGIARCDYGIALVSACCITSEDNLVDRSYLAGTGQLGKFVATLRGHVGPVYRLAWSADSRMLVSASKDATVKVSHIFT